MIGVEILSLQAKRQKYVLAFFSMLITKQYPHKNIRCSGVGIVLCYRLVASVYVFINLTTISRNADFIITLWEFGP